MDKMFDGDMGMTRIFEVYGLACGKERRNDTQSYRV
jgi:hypothetical protein